MSTQKLMRGLSDSNIHTASNNELLNEQDGFGHDDLAR
jgi:hypothetical protein